MSEEEAKALAHKASTQYAWMPNNIYVPEGIHTQFWEIVQAVATIGSRECVFCDGDIDHTPDCIAVKARALMEQVK